MSTPSIQPGRDPAVQYLLRLGDFCLIHAQRLGEWCGHAPILEEDIALTNLALDLIGQARALLTRAGQVGHERGAPAAFDEDQPAEARDALLISAIRGGIDDRLVNRASARVGLPSKYHW